MDDYISRWLRELVHRDEGPLTFRLILQPTMAVLLAIWAGWKDARDGRPAFFWDFLAGAGHRRDLIREGWRDTRRVFILAVIMDLVYQALVFRWLYPLQALVVAALLAIVPYVAVRGAAKRLFAAVTTKRRPHDSKEAALMKEDLEVKPAPGPDQRQLALERTFLAHERTLLAWVRTATSLITFGFVLYKFLLYMHEHDQARHVEQLLGPRTYGLIMIGAGVFTLVLATYQHRRQMKQMRAYFGEAPVSLSAVLASIIAALGVVAFVTAVMRL
jgi:uncharacterized membrane protein YidH (DUF202 family)